MADNYQTNKPDDDLFASVVAEFATIKTSRINFENLWEETAAMVLPEYRGTIRADSMWSPGSQKSELQFDSTATMAWNKFCSIVDSLVTPRTKIYQFFEPEDPALKKSQEVMEYCNDLTSALFRFRYKASANFASQNAMNYGMFGLFGNMGMFIDKLDPRYGKGLRYKALPIGEQFFTENHQGIIDKNIRPIWYTGRQICQKWPETVPAAFRQKCEQQKAHAETNFRVLHLVRPRGDYERGALDNRGQMFESVYVLECEKAILQRGGYRVFPYAFGRYNQFPGEVYARGPANLILPTIKMKNAQKRAFIKQAHRVLDPVLLAHDDGIVDSFSLRPGAINPGGVNADGKPLIQQLEAGNLSMGVESMELEDKIINDAFLVDLFNILRERPQMTATEVLELTKEKGYLIAPLLGRIHSEYLEPMTERELDLLAEIPGALPVMPEVLREAGGFEYALRFESPLARSARGEEVEGFVSTIGSVLEIINATQDPSPLDYFNMDEAVPALADIKGVPARWMQSQEIVDARREQRAQAQRDKAEAEAAPGAAAVLTAAAKARTAGLNLNQAGATE